MRKLPPLNSIRAFEAAARHVSFSKAATELEVTHGAISKQVSILEIWLGVELFNRSRSHLSLTNAGKDFLTSLTPALDRIALSAIQLQDKLETESFTISAPPTFTLRWLIPRISMFQKKLMHIDIKLTTSIDPIDFKSAQYDVGIRGSKEPLPNHVSLPFMTETIVPICHPDLIEKGNLKGVNDLIKHTLISYDTEPLSWGNWLQDVNALHLKPANHLQFEQMYFAIQAAQEGLGVVLAPIFLVADDIIAGKLILPFGLLAARTRRYYLNAPLIIPQNPVFEKFSQWLAQEGMDTEQSIESLCANLNLKV
jgi:LysR family glycine cleavage system transcriptional activator